MSMYSFHFLYVYVFFPFFHNESHIFLLKKIKGEKKNRCLFNTRRYSFYAVCGFSFIPVFTTFHTSGVCFSSGQIHFSVFLVFAFLTRCICIYFSHDKKNLSFRFDWGMLIFLISL